MNKKNIDFYKNESFLYISNFFDKELINELNKSIVLSLDEILKKKNYIALLKIII